MKNLHLYKHLYQQSTPGSQIKSPRINPKPTGQPQEPANGTPNVLNNITLLTTCYDCLRMALLFDGWYLSFLELQPLLGFPRMEMSQMLRQNMKGPKDVHPRDVREEAMKHQQNIQAQKQNNGLKNKDQDKQTSPKNPIIKIKTKQHTWQQIPGLDRRFRLYTNRS